MIYSDLYSEFQIIDFSATHSQLLIRSLRNKNRDYNIDIIFKGVISLLTTTVIKGLEISILKIDEIDRKLINEYGFENSEDYRIFALKDIQGKICFINAMCFGVYHNKLNILETSIGRYDMENLGENILWY